MAINIRVATPSDCERILDLVNEFAQGHPSKNYPRKAEYLKDAYFGPKPSAEILVAERNG